MLSTQSTLYAAVQGLVNVDITLKFDVAATVGDDSIELRGGDSRAVVRTDTRLTPGSKVTSPDRIGEVIPESMIGHYTLGGGVLNVADSLRLVSKAVKAPAPRLHVIDDGAGGLNGNAMAADYVGAGVVSPRPANLIVQLPGDRGIVKQKINVNQDGDTMTIFDKAAYAAREAHAIISASPKIHSLASVLFDNAAGAKYLNPTGGLPRAATARLLAQADHVVLNFNEVGALAGSFGLRVDGTMEDDPGAASIAAQWLRELKQKELAGRSSAIVTMGGEGVVAVDWKHQQMHYLMLQIDPDAAKPTIKGTGDYFLASYVYSMEMWASHDHLKEPVLSAAHRATRLTCGWLGIPNDAIYIRTVVL